MRPLVISLPKLLPAQNVALRTHWASRRKARINLAWEIAAELGRQRTLAPIERASVEITRYYCGTPLDPDNLAASAKHVLDVLQPPSRRCPTGLAVIAGDDPAHLALTLRQVRVPHRHQQRTLIMIAETTS